MEHHGAALLLLTKDESLVAQLKKDYTQAQIDDKMKSALHYAEQLTRHPHSVKDSHVAELREWGWTDREILDICQIASYFNFVNRMAEGLGVELEQE